jgi:hypothetical protein
MQALRFLDILKNPKHITLPKKKKLYMSLRKSKAKQSKTNRLHTTKKISTKNQPAVCKKKKKGRSNASKERI